MKFSGLKTRNDNAALDRADLLRQARGVFGADCTMQLYGAGGRILAEDGRKVTFASMAELAELIDKERTDSEATRPIESSWWLSESLAR